MPLATRPGISLGEQHVRAIRGDIPGIKDELHFLNQRMAVERAKLAGATIRSVRWSEELGGGTFSYPN